MCLAKRLLCFETSQQFGCCCRTLIPSTDPSILLCMVILGGKGYCCCSLQWFAVIICCRTAFWNCLKQQFGRILWSLILAKEGTPDVASVALWRARWCFCSVYKAIWNVIFGSVSMLKVGKWMVRPYFWPDKVHLYVLFFCFFNLWALLVSFFFDSVR